MVPLTYPFHKFSTSLRLLLALFDLDNAHGHSFPYFHEVCLWLIFPTHWIDNLLSLTSIFLIYGLG